MTDRPILFSAPMVRALLDGRKTQTRRVLTRNNATVLGHSWRGKSCPWEGLRFDEAIARSKSPMTGTHDTHLAVPFCHPADEPTPSEDCGIYAVRPLVETGDRLWVRENWYAAHSADGVKPRDMDSTWKVCPAVDWNYADWGIKGRLRPGIHMPRWASRLTLTVTDVRVQRLQNIDEIDAMAEGIIRSAPTEEDEAEFMAIEGGDIYSSAVDAYQALWNRINVADTWAANPWIVAVTFTVERRNIDA